MKKIFRVISKINEIIEEKDIAYKSYFVPDICENKVLPSESKLLLERVSDYANLFSKVNGGSKIWQSQLEESNLKKLWEALQMKDLPKALFYLENSRLLDYGRVAATYSSPVSSFREKFYEYLKTIRVKQELKKMFPISASEMGVVTNFGGAFGFHIDKKVINDVSIRHTYDALSLKYLAQQGTILEIGGGHGGLAAKAFQLSICNKYIIIDLPQMLVVAFYFLATAFPSLRISFLHPNSDQENVKSLYNNSDILLVGAEESNLLSDISINVAFNSYSFSEMTEETVNGYIDLINKLKIPYLLHENFSGMGHSDLVSSKKFDFQKLIKIQELLVLPEANRKDCSRELFALSLY